MRNDGSVNGRSVDESERVDGVASRASVAMPRGCQQPEPLRNMQRMSKDPESGSFVHALAVAGDELRVMLPADTGLCAGERVLVEADGFTICGSVVRLLGLPCVELEARLPVTARRALVRRPRSGGAAPTPPDPEPPRAA